MKIFSQLCTGLVMLIVSAVVNGIVVSHMWNWFIVPLGVSPIGFWLAVGISMTTFLLIPQRSNDIVKEEFSDVVARDLAVIIAKFMVLGLGAIVRLFI